MHSLWKWFHSMQYSGFVFCKFLVFLALTSSSFLVYVYTVVVPFRGICEDFADLLADSLWNVLSSPMATKSPGKMKVDQGFKIQYSSSLCNDRGCHFFSCGTLARSPEKQISSYIMEMSCDRITVFWPDKPARLCLMASETGNKSFNSVAHKIKWVHVLT